MSYLWSHLEHGAPETDAMPIPQAGAGRTPAIASLIDDERAVREWRTRLQRLREAERAGEADAS